MVKENSNPLLGDEISNEYELYVDGEWKKNPKRVTDQVKKYYLEKFKNKPPFTKEEDRDNEFKKQLGIEFHDYFQEIHSRYFNEDGTRREVSKPRPVIEDSKKADPQAEEKPEAEAKKDKALKMGEWNRMKIKVVGDQVTTWLNGTKMIELEDEKIGKGKGSIALQIHDGGGIKVNWRNLQVKPL